jgi:1,4-dihydroxy-2-naphthoate octaprenyltransferase
MATPREWWQGARPRTLPAAIAPVAVGAGLGVHAGAFDAVRVALALGVAVLLQVGVNFANDYSDGIRGTDTVRVGPVRLVGQELASPRAVRTAAYLSLFGAAVLGLVLVILTRQWWLIGVGVACIAAAWLYTGGPRPYGYAGLGEVFVFLFFGPVPVIGTAYVQTLTITSTDVLASLGVGMLICAILVTNNLRDIPGDSRVGKRTLAVRLGDERTRMLYAALVTGALAAPVLLVPATSALIVLTSATGLLAIAPLRTVLGGAEGPRLIPALTGTSVLVLAYGLVLGLLLAVA